MPVHERSPATVILVHGTMHGAWCWDRIARRLTRRGVEYRAIDLPGHGRRHHEWRQASQSSYTAAVTDAIDATEAPVVLVGHSMAGQVVARAATRRAARVRRLVLLNAQVLRDGETHLGTLPAHRQEEYVKSAQAGGGRFRLDNDQVHSRWLQDLPRDDPHTQWALAALTAQPMRPLLEEATGQDFNRAGVPAIYVRSTGDVGSPPERGDRFVARLPPQTPVRYVPGSHDCMISRPDDVAELLAHTSQQDETHDALR